MQKLIYLLIFLFLPFYAFSQQEKVYNDTSYFIPFDEDFNLIMSASKGHINNVINLLNREADINAVTIDGISALMYASENGDIDMAKLLLSYGASPDQKPYNGVTALINACQLNHYEIAEYLITNGANVNLEDENGVSAIHYALAYNYKDLAKMMLFYKADFRKPDKNGTPPIITASFNNSLESIQLLIDNNVDLNTTDKQAYTALMISCQEENTEIVNLLLQNGADPNLTNNGGMTALSFAILSENYGLTEKLINNGANIDHKITGSKNLLELSRHIEDDDITELLITEGAKPNILPSYSKLSLGPGLLFSKNEFMTGLDLNLIDDKYNTAINTSFYFRPTAIRTLTKEVNDTSYQFWERRCLVKIGLEKRFKLKAKANYSMGPKIGADVAYTFGSYRGSNSKPESNTLFSPYIGMYYINKYITLSASYNYLNFNLPDVGNGKINFSLAFNISTASNKMTKKKIAWLNK